jgi:hypothetical protein
VTDQTSRPKTVAPSVKVFGDSIMDSGTFGYKFTIQGPDKANPYLLFPEIVAANFGVPKLCPFFNFNGTTFLPNTACTNFAVAGARVNNLVNSTPGAASNTSPFSVTYQLATGSATLAPTDLVIVDGGGNDLAELVGAYLGASTPAGVVAYMTALGTLLPPTTVATIIGAVPTATSMGNAGGAYAQAIGTTLAASIKANVIAKGVSKVVVINAPTSPSRRASRRFWVQWLQPEVQPSAMPFRLRHAHGPRRSMPAWQRVWRVPAYSCGILYGRRKDDCDARPVCIDQHLDTGLPQGCGRNQQRRTSRFGLCTHRSGLQLDQHVGQHPRGGDLCELVEGLCLLGPIPLHASDQPTDRAIHQPATRQSRLAVIHGAKPS